MGCPLACSAPPAAESPAADAYASHPEMALVALMTLMTRFPARQSPALAQAVLRHLHLIVEDARFPLPLRDNASRLMFEWANYLQLSATEPNAGNEGAAH